MQSLGSWACSWWACQAEKSATNEVLLKNIPGGKELKYLWHEGLHILAARDELFLLHGYPECESNLVSNLPLAQSMPITEPH